MTAKARSSPSGDATRSGGKARRQDERQGQTKSDPSVASLTRDDNILSSRGRGYGFVILRAGFARRISGLRNPEPRTDPPPPGMLGDRSAQDDRQESTKKAENLRLWPETLRFAMLCFICNPIKKGLPAASYSPTDSLRSTIGAGGLNCRVRHGTGCDPSAMTTGNPIHVSP